MKTAYSIVISLVATGLFVAGALLKQGTARLDVYLGAIWVLILSLIVVLSLSHVFTGGRGAARRDRGPGHH